MKKVLIIIWLILSYFLFAQTTQALTFDLIAPSGQLERGQEIKFTINVNTEGRSYSSTQIGMTYDTQYLEYISVSAGNTFTTVSANPQEGGKLIISGNSSSGYSGSGVFAYVTFKIIAASSGATQLCVLFNPDTTPTPLPTSPPISTFVPTSLPTSGDINGVGRGLTFGLIFLILAGSGFLVFKNL